MENVVSPIFVNNSDELNSAIGQANACTSGVITILIQDGFTLTANIAPINAPGAAVEIQSAKGGSISLNGANSYNGFVILNGKVLLQNLSIENMFSSGMSGCLGAGAGLFVANTSGYQGCKQIYTPAVTLNNISFTGCSAKGGDVLSSSAASGGAGGVLDQGDAGAPGLDASGNNVFGTQAEAGCFGVLGVPGSGGGGGYGGGDDDDGNPGGDGSTGGSSGFGGGASAGGGGGGGGAGGCGRCDWFGACDPGGNGATGGTGGSSGAPGFGGGGHGTGPSGGLGGGGNNQDRGGPGGNGGFGGLAGGGAGFGGGIFAMDNANITFQGSGTISGNQVIGGTSPDATSNGSSAGAGIFLQGSGNLNFNLQSGDTYTIEDEVSDETGAVSYDKATSMLGVRGPDGLPTGGGTGAWTINKTGQGTLVLKGRHLHAGAINALGGALDVSDYVSGAAPSLSLKENTKLIQQAKTAVSKLKLNTLSISRSATLHVNGHSRIEANEVNFPDELFITIDSLGKGFQPGVPVQIMSWTVPINGTPLVNITSGYTCRVRTRSITILKNS